MGMKRTLALLIAALATGAAGAQAPSANEEAQRAERWQQLKQAIFPERAIEDGSNVLGLEAPPRAHDAALVPLTVTTSGATSVETVYLIIDNNPGPLAGKFTFGEAADPSVLKVRMRVNTYTDIHAVAESADGKLYTVQKFVKAAGGCSAPAGSNDAKALEDLGQMRLRLPPEVVIGKPVQTQLMIRHPNFNGMQMDQITRHYTPAHFIKTIEVTFEGKHVLAVQSDIALSTDPVITFGFVPHKEGKLKVVVNDSKDNRFERSFDVVPSQRMTDVRWQEKERE
jgi:sulfur-oxidizing protein SoxY